MVSTFEMMARTGSLQDPELSVLPQTSKVITGNSPLSSALEWDLALAKAKHKNKMPYKAARLGVYGKSLPGLEAPKKGVYRVPVLSQKGKSLIVGIEKALTPTPVPIKPRGFARVKAWFGRIMSRGVAKTSSVTPTGTRKPWPKNALRLRKGFNPKVAFEKLPTAGKWAAGIGLGALALGVTTAVFNSGGRRRNDY